ncbi:MAG TPA: hypothetical protein VF984_12130 [Actinomycetota bacterium]
MKRFYFVMAVVGVVGLATAVPASAQAYGGGPGLSCSNEVVVGDHFPPNTTPTVYVDGQPVGNAQVGGDGTFQFPLPSSVGPGVHTITVQGTSVSTTCTVPTSSSAPATSPPPTSPPPTSPPPGGQPSIDCPGNAVVGEGFTPGSSLAIYIDGELTGHATVGSNGNFRFRLPSALEAGDHTVRVGGLSLRATCSVNEVGGKTIVKTPPKGTAFTGATISLLALVAVGLFLAGAAGVTAGRRRARRDGSPAGGDRSGS